jgi:hypothetical protein
MDYLAFKIYLIKCPRVSSNGDIGVLDNCFNIIIYIHLFIIYIFIYLRFIDCFIYIYIYIHLIIIYK